MNTAAEKNLRLALNHNAIAKVYLEACKHESEGFDKRLVKGLIQKVNAIENSIFSWVPDHQVERFREQIKRTDFLQFEHIFTQLMLLEKTQLDTVEQMIDMLVKGEEIMIEHNGNSFPDKI